MQPATQTTVPIFPSSRWSASISGQTFRGWPEIGQPLLLVTGEARASPPRGSKFRGAPPHAAFEGDRISVTLSVERDVRRRALVEDAALLGLGEDAEAGAVAAEDQRARGEAVEVAVVADVRRHIEERDVGVELGEQLDAAALFLGEQDV